jgi:hypothetical protein
MRSRRRSSRNSTASPPINLIFGWWAIMCNIPTLTDVTHCSSRIHNDIAKSLEGPSTGIPNPLQLKPMKKHLLPLVNAIDILCTAGHPPSMNTEISNVRTHYYDIGPRESPFTLGTLDLRKTGGPFCYFNRPPRAMADIPTTLLHPVFGTFLGL